ncbi:uncharacterized protein BDW43DRAFT_268872 [Aspergillus alliaceus]|uniref:uncharacterized protein n=1 Tax=Petromyces alliaceus TaxID=209559 RepID=UPI0012A4BCBD|nr:uncharacterized protein BDW43DRAFT_268872 [Aspergillus alliaceus]KAB8236020.1 hypothetical protein BDW43DRAFT_268872 [Aspergillus alliaceus]
MTLQYLFHVQRLRLLPCICLPWHVSSLENPGERVTLHMKNSHFARTLRNPETMHKQRGWYFFRRKRRCAYLLMPE